MTDAAKKLKSKRRASMLEQQDQLGASLKVLHGLRRQSSSYEGSVIVFDGEGSSLDFKGHDDEGASEAKGEESQDRGPMARVFGDHQRRSSDLEITNRESKGVRFSDINNIQVMEDDEGLDYEDVMEDVLEDLDRTSRRKQQIKGFWDTIKTRVRGTSMGSGGVRSVAPWTPSSHGFTQITRSHNPPPHTTIARQPGLVRVEFRIAACFVQRYRW